MFHDKGGAKPLTFNQYIFRPCYFFYFEIPNSGFKSGQQAVIHENGRHDEDYPHGGQHTNKHDKDGEHHFQIVETKRAFEYDADGKLLSAVEDEERQGQYVCTFEYDDMEYLIMK